jgi:hypothetical protein
LQRVNWVALTIFVPLFVLIIWLGFGAATRRKGDLDLLHEWGLGGRRFGTVITWFLSGGDLYTAYTFVGTAFIFQQDLWTYWRLARESELGRRTARASRRTEEVAPTDAAMAGCSAKRS